MATENTQPAQNATLKASSELTKSSASTQNQELAEAYSMLAIQLGQSLSAERLLATVRSLKGLPTELCLVALSRWADGTLRSRVSSDKTCFLPTAHQLREEIEFITHTDYEAMCQDGYDFVLWYIPRHGFSGQPFNVKRDPQTDKIIDPGEPAPPVPPLIALTLENLGNGDIRLGFRAMAEHHRVPKPPGYQGDHADPEKLEKRWRKAFDRAWKAT